MLRGSAPAVEEMKHEGRKHDSENYREEDYISRNWAGVLYWILGSTIDIVVFRQGNFIEEIFTLDSHKIWMRSLVLCILIMSSFYAQGIITERKRAEATLARRGPPQLEITICDFKFLNTLSINWNIKSSGNLSILRLTA